MVPVGARYEELISSVRFIMIDATYSLLIICLVILLTIGGIIYYVAYRMYHRRIYLPSEVLMDAIVYLLITFIIVTVGGIQGTICPTIINTNRTTTAIILISKTMLYVITEIMLLQQRTRYPRIFKIYSSAKKESFLCRFR